jgi:hypothetical protein
MKAPIQGQFENQWAHLFPFAEFRLEFNVLTDVAAGLLTRADTFQQVKIPSGSAGDTMSFTIPDSVLNLSGATMLVLAGTGGQITDVAPNGGFISIGN